MTPDPKELETFYRQRFAGSQEYRKRVWQVLIRDFFGEFVQPEDTVLDLGCGYGEFINQIRCGSRFGMDLNRESLRHLETGIQFLQQDCSDAWALADGGLKALTEQQR